MRSTLSLAAAGLLSTDVSRPDEPRSPNTHSPDGSGNHPLRRIPEYAKDMAVQPRGPLQAPEPIATEPQLESSSHPKDGQFGYHIE